MVGDIPCQPSGIVRVVDFQGHLIHIEVESKPDEDALRVFASDEVEDEQLVAIRGWDDDQLTVTVVDGGAQVRDVVYDETTPIEQE